MGTLFRPQVILIAAIAAVAALGGSPALAQSEVTISATVTVKNISIVLTDPGDPGILYGIVDLSETNVAPSPDDLLIATNDGNVEEDFFIKGTDATGTGEETWSLVKTTPANNTYNHKFGLAPGGALGTLAAFGTTNENFKADLAANGFAEFKLRLSTPTTTGTFGERSMDVIVIAVESAGAGF